jgi:exodeoxyribonuclease III
VTPAALRCRAPMKITTYNINSIRARLERFEAWLESRKPDVLCLQELKVEEDKFPFDLFEQHRYSVAISAQKSYNGVAIATRLGSPEDVTRGLGDGVDDPQARLIAATVQGVRVVNVYAPNGQAPGTEKYQYKLTWFERLRTFLQREIREHGSVVVCGDYNVAPADIDVHDPAKWEGQIHCSPPERAALASLTTVGLTDALRHLDPERVVYTWWDYRMLSFPKNKGLRIDHFLVSDEVLPRVVEVEVDREARKGKQPSDHAPVVLELRDD